MKLEILGAYGGESPDCNVTCLLINGTIALDAGSLSKVLPIERQLAVHDVVLTHSHVDHIASLPFFIENTYGDSDRAIEIHASRATIYAVRRHLFNNTVWPDFTRLPNNLLPKVKFRELAEEVPTVIEGVRFTPFRATHTVSTFGYLIEQGDAAVIWSSDTGPTVRLWELANQAARLDAVLLDTSFDNSLEAISRASLHLTPRALGLEIEKLDRDIPILLHHLKPPCVKRIRKEVGAMKLDNVEFLEQGETYRF
jgi:ribonuclease BN (tRNA processing enzyme)